MRINKAVGEQVEYFPRLLAGKAFLLGRQIEFAQERINVLGQVVGPLSNQPPEIIWEFGHSESVPVRAGGPCNKVDFSGDVSPALAAPRLESDHTRYRTRRIRRRPV